MSGAISGRKRSDALIALPHIFMGTNDLLFGSYKDNYTLFLHKYTDDTPSISRYFTLTKSRSVSQVSKHSKLIVSYCFSVKELEKIYSHKFKARLSRKFHPRQRWLMDSPRLLDRICMRSRSSILHLMIYLVFKQGCTIPPNYRVSNEFQSRHVLIDGTESSNFIHAFSEDSLKFQIHNT